MRDSRPILVTGSPRSGSTWVGRVIAHAPSVRYVHEPFNISGRPCACGVTCRYWFCYVCRENESDICRHIKHSTGRSTNIVNVLNVLGELRATWRLRPATRYARSLFATRPLLKDPLAVFSAEWLVSTFDMNAVVVIRHPAAVVSSYKTLGWSQPFSHFLNQPALMTEHLLPFESEIRDFAEKQHDIVDQAAMVWKLVHFMIAKYQRAHRDWIFVRHEDLSRDPVKGFEDILAKLELDFSGRLARMIQEHSATRNPVDTDDPYSVKRNSLKNIRHWRTKLTAEEIARIRARVEDVATAFYSDDDW